MTDVLMPALSPTMEEGALAKWRVKAGDTVAAGDVIAEIETDKATMEVEAVDEGVVEEILVPEGAQGVKVNTPIARLKGDAAAPSPSEPKAAETKAPVAGASSGDPRAARDQGQEEARVGQAGPTAAAAAEPPPPAADGPAKPQPAPAASAEAAPRLFASPLARRLAKEAGADLSSLKGSGPHGRILAADVQAAGQGATAPAEAAAPPPPSKAVPAPTASPPAPAAPEAPPRKVGSIRADSRTVAPKPGAPKAAGAGPGQPASAAPQDAVEYLQALGVAPGSYTLQPLDMMRRTIARRLTDSFRDVPHFPLSVDLEIDRLLDARARINGALGKAGGARVSVNDILIKASALALKAVPAANASFTPKGIALHNHADVAVAVAIEGGLITPIVREAETRSLADISAAMKDLAARARDRKLKPEEFQGGTFSLSNLGMFGVKSFGSILNQPQGMILSVGAGEKRPVVHGDQLAVATVMSVTLTCDHRVVDGATGAGWLQAFKGFVEDPVTMLA